MRTLARIAAVVVAALPLLGVPTAGAAPTTHRRPPVTFHLHFRPVAQNVVGIVADDTHAFVSQGIFGPDNLGLHRILQRETGTLIFDATGRRRALSPPCPLWQGAMFGGPWLMVDCENQPAPALYNLSTHRWHTLPSPPGGPCGAAAQVLGYCVPVAVGRDWLELMASDCSGCAFHYLLEDVVTGAVKAAPITPGGRTTVDLDRRSGERALCAPLRYPKVWNVTANAYQPGWLQFYGSTAVAGGGPPPGWGPFTVTRLEHCASSLRVQLPVRAGAALAGSSTEIAWPATVSRLNGYFTTTFRPFTVRLPASVAAPAGSPLRIALTLDHLYVLPTIGEYGNTLYRAASSS